MSCFRNKYFYLSIKRSRYLPYTLEMFGLPFSIKLTSRSAIARWHRRRFTLDLVFRYLAIKIFNTTKLAMEDTINNEPYPTMLIICPEPNLISSGRIWVLYISHWLVRFILVAVVNQNTRGIKTSNQKIQLIIIKIIQQ